MISQYCLTMFFQFVIFFLVASFIYLIPDRDWDLERKIKIEQYLLNEVMNSNIDQKDVEEAIHDIELEHEETKEQEITTGNYYSALIDIKCGL